MALAMRRDAPAELAHHHLGAEADAEKGLLLLQGHADPVDLAPDPGLVVIGAHRPAEDHRPVMLGERRRQGIVEAGAADIELVAPLAQERPTRPGVECS